MQLASYTMTFQFTPLKNMRNSVKCFGKIHKYNINIVTRINHTGNCIEKSEQISHGRPPMSKIMPRAQYQGIFFQIINHWVSDDRFNKFTDLTVRSVIIHLILASFLINWTKICALPVSRLKTRFLASFSAADNSVCRHILICSWRLCFCWYTLIVLVLLPLFIFYCLPPAGLWW